MEDQLLRILIVATGRGGCRSLMLAGWLKRFGERRIRADIGSIHAGDPDPLAVRAMHEIGLDVTGYRAAPLVKWLDDPWDWVVLMRSPRRYRKPDLTAAKRMIYHEFPDPAKGLGDEEAVMGHYRNVRDEIHDWARTFVERTIGLSKQDRERDPASDLRQQF